MKYIANLITLLRIPFAAAMLLSPPFSTAFWCFYLCGGLTDMLDGFAARRLHQQSAVGAKLDSVADGVFALAIASVVLINLVIPIWLWVCILCIALLRFVGYGIGFYKYRAFSSLHTYANKAAGALLFAAPVLYALLGFTAAGILLCMVAFLSAVEEVAITVTSGELDRDRKSILIP